MRQRNLTAIVLLARLLGIVVASYLLAQVLIGSVDSHLSAQLTDVVESTIIAIASALGLWWGLLRSLHVENQIQAFDQQLQTALSMAATEAAGYDVVRRAMETAGVAGHAQLMLADSSEAHLKVAVDHQPSAEVPGCSVGAPFDCPAIHRAQTIAFGADTDLDACPWLANRRTIAGDAQPLGAVCIPLNVVGRSIGVLHVAAPASKPTPPAVVRSLEAIAERASGRIGLLRVMEKTHLQAATDPLTGLLNRRSLENHLHDLLKGHQPFALAMADLDHFKTLNDTHGHEVGDRALRVFARTVRASLRADDIFSRYGGEEFVIVFPHLSATEAAGALERAREALALTVNEGTVPPFTASYGVADSLDAGSIEELLRLADAALFHAKRRGRNRVIVDGSDSVPVTPE